MSRAWKPGDVAVVEWFGEPPMVMIRVEANKVCPSHHSRGEHWHSLRGTFADRIDGAESVRPLVVIDPESREQVEILRDLWDGAHTKQQGHPPTWSSKGARGNALQAALRELADPKPPKPAEPTGLGAVVEDANGQRWVRATANTDDDCAWVRAERYQTRGEAWCYESYDMCVPAVRVLSEGVTA